MELNRGNTMIKTFALGIVTLLAAASFASANDLAENFKGIEGSYQHKSRGEMKIRK